MSIPVSPHELKAAFGVRIANKADYRHWVLVRLLNRQTSAERRYHVSRERNGRGFTAPDAKVLTPIAEALLGGKRLTNAQEQTLIARLNKYWGQFVTAALETPSAPGPRKPPQRESGMDHRGERVA